MTENSGPRDDHSIKSYNGFLASDQRPIYIHITLYTGTALVCFSLKKKDGREADTRAHIGICPNVTTSNQQILAYPRNFPRFFVGLAPDPVPSLHLQINCGCFAKEVKLKAAVVNRR